ncbi:MAG: hypothetical protein ACP5QG_07255 [candidate division WOR-3 bacterium]
METKDNETRILEFPKRGLMEIYAGRIFKKAGVGIIALQEYGHTQSSGSGLFSRIMNQLFVIMGRLWGRISSPGNHSDVRTLRHIQPKSEAR